MAGLQERWQTTRARAGEQRAHRKLEVEELQRLLREEEARRSQLAADAQRWEAVATEFAERVAVLEGRGCLPAPLPRARLSPREALAAADAQLRTAQAATRVAGGWGKPCHRCCCCSEAPPAPAAPLDAGGVLARARAALGSPSAAGWR